METGLRITKKTDKQGDVRIIKVFPNYVPTQLGESTERRDRENYVEHLKGINDHQSHKGTSKVLLEFLLVLCSRPLFELGYLNSSRMFELFVEKLLFQYHRQIYKKSSMPRPLRAYPQFCA